jgi:hypothetical protein
LVALVHDPPRRIRAQDHELVEVLIGRWRGALLKRLAHDTRREESRIHACTSSGPFNASAGDITPADP